MTPEEAFKKWWNELRIVNTRLYSCVELVRMAWTQAQQEGYYQGMTRAAEICEREMKCYEIYSSTHFGEPKKHYEACMTAILTERDREEK